ncbi:Fic family protein [bacterium]|nr:MAG: Fic family protein [bacterium]
MKMPVAPPGPDAGDFVRLLDHPGILEVEPEGKYLHWDELRHRKPPEGVSSEKWWWAVKIARKFTLKNYPLKDKEGNFFKFLQPDSIGNRLRLLERKTAGALSGVCPDANVSIRDNFIVSSLFEESITSSQLEGAVTTTDVAKKMLLEQREPRNKSEWMILNNYRAMEFIRGNAKEKLTPELILELHSVVTHNTLDNPKDAGKLRKTDDIVVQDSLTGERLHTPPGADTLRERLRDLCAFANAPDDSSPFVHPLIRAILIHFQLAYDHPFVDGNGRTARSLFYWSALNRGYWLMEYLSISAEINRARAKYYRAFLYTETDEGDATYFIMNQLETIERALKRFEEKVAKKTEETKRAKDLLSGFARNLNSRQIELLRHALSHPGAEYSIKEHQTYHNLAYATARSDLLELERMGLLTMVKTGRKFHFLAPSGLPSKIAPNI